MMTLTCLVTSLEVLTVLYIRHVHGISLMNATNAWVDVCIATCERPDQLALTLQALREQRLDGYRIRIILVDNSPSRSAYSIAREFSSKMVLIYDWEPVPNLSLARNRCLRHIDTRSFAMIDDDEIPSSRWLEHLLIVQRRWSADVVHGPVLPSYAEDVPRRFRDAGAFLRPNPATGSTRGFIRNTGNCLLSAHVLDRLPFWFDPAFGLSGGEDTDFFQRLARQGVRFVWCREAAVYERISRDRANIRWLMRRQFRNGGVHIKAKRLKAGERALCLVVLALLLPVSLLLYGITILVVWRPSFVFALARRLAFHLGALTFCLGWEYREYEKGTGIFTIPKPVNTIPSHLCL